MSEVRIEKMIQARKRMAWRIAIDRNSMVSANCQQSNL